jgi:hypothetical protein
MPGKSVSRRRAFRQGILPWRKGVDIPVDSRCAACRPRLTAAQGPRVEQRAILARTRYAIAARLLELKSQETRLSTLELGLAAGSPIWIVPLELYAQHLEFCSKWQNEESARDTCECQLLGGKLQHPGDI